MKNLFLLTTTLISLMASAETSNVQKIKPQSFKKGYVSVTVETQVEDTNGAFKQEKHKVCEGEVNIPLYSIGEGDVEVEYYDSIKACLVKIHGIEAKVWINPMSLESALTNAESQVGISNQNVPSWLQSVFKKHRKGQTYVASSMILPKDFVFGSSEVKQLSETESKDFFKLMEVFSDSSMSSSQTVSIVGPARDVYILTTELRPSSKYCQNQANDNLCLSQYTIKSTVIFKGQ